MMKRPNLVVLTLLVIVLCVLSGLFGYFIAQRSASEVAQAAVAIAIASPSDPPTATPNLQATTDTLLTQTQFADNQTALSNAMHTVAAYSAMPSLTHTPMPTATTTPTATFTPTPTAVPPTFTPTPRPLGMALYRFDRTGLGTGWGPTEHDADNTSYQWMTSSTTTLPLMLPTTSGAQFDFIVGDGLQLNILDSLSMTANGQPLYLQTLTALQNHLFRAILGQSFLLQSAGNVQLIIHINKTISPMQSDGSPDERQLGLIFFQMNIQPIKPSLLPFQLDLSAPILGQNWCGPEGTGKVHFQWMCSTQAILAVYVPTTRDLVVRFGGGTLDRTIFNSLKLTVNGQPIPLAVSHLYSTDGSFIGRIPQAVLNTAIGATIFEITVDHTAQPPPAVSGISDVRELGLRLQNFTLSLN